MLLYDPDHPLGGNTLSPMSLSLPPAPSLAGGRVSWRGLPAGPSFPSQEQVPHETLQREAWRPLPEIAGGKCPSPPPAQADLAFWVGAVVALIFLKKLGFFVLLLLLLLK